GVYRFFFQAEDGIRDFHVTGVQTCALPICKLETTLQLAEQIEALAEEFADKHHALFLGRGDQYPIAMEGALKLKEISYIHAEARSEERRVGKEGRWRRSPYL